MPLDLGKLMEIWDDALVPLSIQENIAALLANGDLLQKAEFAFGAELTPEALDVAVHEGRILCVEMPGLTLYPAFYLDPALQRDQLEIVTQMLDDRSGGGKMLFFTCPRGSLADSSGNPRTPLQALKDGDLDAVKRAVLGSVER